MTRAIAIGLKIPDNEAHTALTALQRLGVNVARLERAHIWMLEDRGDAQDFVARVERNEALYNPNKHDMRVLEAAAPRAGELWIEELRSAGAEIDDLAIAGGKGIAQVAGGRRYVGWRLFDAEGTPAAVQTVRAAAETLLCNPAIEKAIFGNDGSQGHLE